MRHLLSRSDSRARLVQRAGLPLLVAGLLLSGFWSCGSGESTLIDLTVNVDAALALDKLALRASAPTKSKDLTLDVPLSVRPAHAAIAVVGLSTGAVVTLEISGIEAQATIVITRVRVSVVRGQHVAVTATLAPDCVGVLSCNAAQTCQRGDCIPIPDPVGDAGVVDAPSGQGGATAGAGGANAGTGGGDVAGGAGRGGGGAGLGGRGDGFAGGAGEGGRRATGGAGGGGLGGRGTGGAGGSRPGGAAGTGQGGSGVGAGGASTGGVSPGSGGAIPGSGGATPGTGGTSTGGAGAPGGRTGAGGAGGAVVPCGSTRHMCSGTCVDNDSVDHCGPSSCTPCLEPTGGSADCVGNQCVSSCSTGQKLCVVGPSMFCVSTTGCCVTADCPGQCQTCDSASHACVALTSQDDPTDRCKGTCNATGACVSRDCSAGPGTCPQGTSCLASRCCVGTSCGSGDDGLCCTPAGCPNANGKGQCMGGFCSRPPSCL